MITVGQAHKNTWKLYQNISMGTAVFLNQKRANVFEHTTKNGVTRVYERCHQGVGRGMDGGKLSEVNAIKN